MHVYNWCFADIQRKGKKEAKRKTTGIKNESKCLHRFHNVVRLIIDIDAQNTGSAETWHLTEAEAGKESQQRPEQRQDLGHDNAAQCRSHS